MPRRVVPHILHHHRLHKVQLPQPQILLVEKRQNPLPMGPCVVVLRVGLERGRDEHELGSRFPRELQDEPAVVPDLVGFEELDGELVHQFELDVKRKIERADCLISILPERWGQMLLLEGGEEHAKQNSVLDSGG